MPATLRMWSMWSATICSVAGGSGFALSHASSAAFTASGFAAPQREYDATADNHPMLRQYFDYHLPFYEKLIRHAVR